MVNLIIITAAVVIIIDINNCYKSMEEEGVMAVMVIKFNSLKSEKYLRYLIYGIFDTVQ